MGTPYIPIKKALANRIDLAYVPRNAQDNNIAFGLGPCSKMQVIEGRHENQCWGSFPSQWYLKKDHSAACMLEQNLLNTQAYYSNNPSNNITMYEQSVPTSNAGYGIDIIYGSARPKTDIYGLSLAGERPPNDDSEQLSQRQRETNCLNYVNYGRTSDENINFNDQPSPYRYAYDPKNLGAIQNGTNNFIRGTRAYNPGPQTVILTNSKQGDIREDQKRQDNNNEHLYPQSKCRYYPGNQPNVKQIQNARQKLLVQNQQAGNAVNQKPPTNSNYGGPNYSSTNTYCTTDDINQVKHYPGLTRPVCSSN